MGNFALAIRAEVNKDQETLEGIIDQVGKANLDVTEAAGWLAEKASKFKLRRDDSSGGLGTFEARIPELDFEELRVRANSLKWRNNACSSLPSPFGPPRNSTIA